MSKLPLEIRLSNYLILQQTFSSVEILRFHLHANIRLHTMMKLFTIPLLKSSHSAVMQRRTVKIKLQKEHKQTAHIRSNYKWSLWSQPSSVPLCPNPVRGHFPVSPKDASTASPSQIRIQRIPVDHRGNRETPTGSMKISGI